MAERRVIFFDVGNTLLFPNRTNILAPLPTELQPTLEQWQALERRTKTEFDRGMQDGKIDQGFWFIFHTYLLQEVGPDMGAREALVKNTQSSANWDQILPGTRASLERIGASFRLAVISNSDGRIDRVLARSGIGECFESITDSGTVGAEKPRREIFDAALQSMKASAEQSLYVGDVYSVDYVGARAAGMDAILFDVAGAYRDRRKVARVESLEQLESWL
jgi:putative hydrolase of the HAD superfamily